MSSLGRSFGSLSALGGRLEDLLASARARASVANGTANFPRPAEVAAFGDNPGDLRMLVHVPQVISPSPGLVVALHGCGQTGAEYAHGTGWSRLAERCGFIVLYPEQHAGNNPKSCFSWFNPADTRRGRGEVQSVQSMVDHAVSSYGIDRGKIFVTGLSAGGAMASALLACYPDVYAAGTIIGGLPHGCASTVQEALELMFSDVPTRSADALSDHIRIASRHAGPWPRVTVWHGTADPIVKPVNGEQVVRQWIGVHGLSQEPDETEQLGSHLRRAWRARSGAPAVEHFSVTGMAHGVPLGLRGNESVGAAGPFFLDAGLCSTRRSAVAWGLADPAILRDEQEAVEGRYDAASTAAIGGMQTSWPLPQGTLDPVAVIDAALKGAGIGSGEVRGVGAGLSPQQIIDDALRRAGLKR